MKRLQNIVKNYFGEHAFKRSHLEYESCDLSEADTYAIVQSLFKNINLSRLPALSPNAPPDALANYVMENVHLFEKIKSKPTVRNVETMEHTVVNMADVQRACAAESSTMLLAFMDRFHQFFDAQNLAKDEIYDKEITIRLIHQHFPFCRSLLIEHLVEEFSGRYSTAALICFMVESNYAYLVRKYFFHIDDATWEAMSTLLPMPRKRRKNWIDAPTDGAVASSVKHFNSFIAESKTEFSEIFDDDDRISKDAESVPRKEKTFTCCVCFDDFLLKSAVSCSSSSELIDLSNQQTTSTESVDTAPHHFCVECVRGQAIAATTEMPLADGGVGLKCMEANCDNPILFSNCRPLIPYRIQKILNERIIEENLGMADLNNLERCTRCPYAVIIEAPNEELKVFSCQKCGYEYCRVCGREWDDKHFGKPCEELDELEKVDRCVHNIQNKMSEAVIRKCPKCGLPFVKWDGCNKMVCRCGLTQCYVCRKSKINYTHFCRHMHQPGKKCKQCKDKCLLWENVDGRNKAELERIRKEALQMGVIIDENGQVKSIN